MKEKFWLIQKEQKQKIKQKEIEEKQGNQKAENKMVNINPYR